MKKLALLMVLLLIINVLAGCGGSGGGSNTGVSGDSSLTNGIISLLNTICSALVNGDATAIANCATYPVTEIFEGVTNTFDTYEEYRGLYAETFAKVDITKYIISNAKFQPIDSNTGTVTFTSNYSVTIPEVGSASVTDEIELNVINQEGQWKYNVFEVLSSVVSSSSITNYRKLENTPAPFKTLFNTVK